MADISRKASAMNVIWISLMLASITVALFSGRMEQVTAASFDAAKKAVELSIGLIGAMALWLGLVRVAEEAGLMAEISRLIRPIMTRLFPDVPPGHPAMAAMVLNLSANIMGLGNAATPLGIKAMQELDRLNPQKGTATDAMCLFLAINTSSVTLLPLGVIAVRSAAGCSNPSAIVAPTILSTTFSTLVAIVAAKLGRRIWGPLAASVKFEDGPTGSACPQVPQPPKGPKGWRRLLVPSFVMLFLLAFSIRVLRGGAHMAGIGGFTHWLIPFLMGVLVIFGWSRGVAVYEAVCEGAKEGFNVAVRIIPFLVAILVAIGMFRESGALGLLSKALCPLMGLVGVPPETLPMALVRPLSGSGAFGIMSDIVARAPDSLGAFVASIMQGSTETTFYVLAIYFGAVEVKNVRYALAAALLADCAGIMAATVLGRAFY